MKLTKITKQRILWFTILTLILAGVAGCYWYFYMRTEEGPVKEVIVEEPLNIILLIGDGMGPEHLELIKQYEDKEYNFEACPSTLVSTASATEGEPTDSAAAATAIATGQTVNNGVISMRIPGDEADLPTLLEQFQDKGKSTGLITTTGLAHATPAAFGAHTAERGNTTEILEDYFNQSKPTVIMGGQAEGDRELAQAQGYTIVTTLEELLSLDATGNILGTFGSVGHMPFVQERGSTIPSLLDMAKVSIRILDEDQDGFFLMIEGGRIDHASHANETENTIYELEEFMSVAEYAYTWAQRDGNTIVVVTADHETGGLSLPSDILPGVIPEVTWNTGGHTATDVPIYVCSPDRADLNNTVANIDIYDLIGTY